ncbi:hypothetical protein ATCC90586_001117 [Pythium insidiosum]|nr:hypothetical protein ATCC90586_001117 [Pythium insidiosum]
MLRTLPPAPPRFPPSPARLRRPPETDEQVTWPRRALASPPPRQLDPTAASSSSSSNSRCAARTASSSPSSSSLWIDGPAACAASSDDELVAIHPRRLSRPSSANSARPRPAKEQAFGSPSVSVSRLRRRSSLSELAEVERRLSDRPTTTPTSTTISHPLARPRLDESPPTYRQPNAMMMALNVVPSVVLHFHGFRSSLLASLWDACWIIMTDIVKKAIVLTLSGAAVAVMLVAVKGALLVVLQGSCFVWTINATFWACEGMAVACAGKPSALLGKAERPESVASTDKLPRLQVAGSIAVVPSSHAEAAEVSAKMDKADSLLLPRLRLSPRTSQALHHRAPSSSSLSQLPARRRLVDHLRAPPVLVNPVRGERRRRADVTLHQSKVRVGKAFLDPVAARQRANGARVERDMYVVRVDCSRPDDKHMNPVVMWDFTATFDEFRKLERDLKLEVKTKRLRNVSVPHLSSGAILFVQPELTPHVLNARRDRLQQFVTAITQDRVLADLDATRKFCQAF